MTSFFLEEALSEASAAGSSTSSKFMRYILGNKIPGVHDHVDDDVTDPCKVMVSPILGAVLGGRPRQLVNGAPEDHIIPGLYQLNSEGWDSHNFDLESLNDQREGEIFFGEPKVIAGGVFHSKFLDFLEEHGRFLMRNLKDVERNCSMLLSVADNLKVLTPSNDPLPWDIMNMAKWEGTLWELIKELKTVEARCPSLIRCPGVYVMTTSPYGALLRALAAEIADAAERTKKL